MLHRLEAEECHKGRLGVLIIVGDAQDQKRART